MTESSQYYVVARQLAEVASEKEKQSTTKRLQSILEDLCVPIHVDALKDTSVDIYTPLCKLFRYEDNRVQSLAHFLLCNLVRLRDKDNLITAIVQEATKGSDNESLNTKAVILRTVINIMESAPYDMAIPIAVRNMVVEYVLAYATPGKEKKKLISIKSSKQEAEKRDRAIHHLACLMCFRVWNMGLDPPLLKAIVATTVEYSKPKAKAIHVPLIREALMILLQHAEQQGVDLKCMAQYLPIKSHNSKPTLSEKDKKRDKKKESEDEPVIYSTEDPFTTVNLVGVCLQVLINESKGQGDSEMESSTLPFAVCLKHLIHHQSSYVFSEAVSGLFGAGLFSLMLEPDIVYAGSTDTVLDYVVYRVQTLLNATGQLEIHAGLRLASAVCEHTTRFLLKSQLDPSHVERLANLIFQIEKIITKRTFQFCPHITYNTSLALLWMSAFFLTLSPEDNSTEMEQTDWKYQQISMLEQTITNILSGIITNLHWSPHNTTGLLLTFLQVLKTVSEDVKHIMIPQFSRLLVELYSNTPEKVDDQQLQPLLVDFMVHIDVYNSKTESPTENDMDVDGIAYSRGNSADYTLAIVLQLVQRLTWGDQQSASRVSRRDAINRRKQWVRVILILVRFLGEHGNVLAADYGCPSQLAEAESNDVAVHSNPKLMRVIYTLHALTISGVQGEVTRECVMSMATIAFRSNQEVRGCVLQALEGIQTLRADDMESDVAQVVTPVISILRELQDLQDMLDQLQGLLDDPSQHATLLQFLDRHEALKKLISLYCNLKDDKKFKLLGKPSRAILEQAFKLKYAAQD